jgi:hypothetical protein
MSRPGDFFCNLSEGIGLESDDENDAAAGRIQIRNWRALGAVRRDSRGECSRRPGQKQSSPRSSVLQCCGLFADKGKFRADCTK